MGYWLGIDVTGPRRRVSRWADGRLEDVPDGDGSDEGADSERVRAAVAALTLRFGEGPEGTVVVDRPATADGAAFTVVTTHDARAATDKPESAFALSRGALLADQRRSSAWLGAGGVAAGVAGVGSGGPDDSKMSDFGDGRRMGDFGDDPTMSDFGEGRKMSDFGEGRKMDEFAVGAAAATTAVDVTGPPDDEDESSSPRKTGKLIAAAVAVLVLIVAAAAVTYAAVGGNDDDEVAVLPEAVDRTTTSSSTTTPQSAAPKGDYLVEFTVVSVTDPYGDFAAAGKTAGVTFTRRWTITPTCPDATSCDLKVVREAGSVSAPEVIEGTFVSTGEGTWEVADASEDVCFDPETGEQFPDQVVKRTSKMTVRVTERGEDGRPVSFEVENRAVGDVNAVGEAVNCTDTEIVERATGRAVAPFATPLVVTAPAE